MPDYSLIYNTVQRALPDAHSAGVIEDGTLHEIVVDFVATQLEGTASPYAYDALGTADKRNFDLYVGYLLASELMDPLSGGGANGHLILERTLTMTRQWALMPQDQGYQRALLRRGRTYRARLSWLKKGVRNITATPGKSARPAAIPGEALILGNPVTYGSGVAAGPDKTPARVTIVYAITSVTGSGWVAFGDLACDYLDIKGDAGADIEYRRNGAGNAFTIAAGSSRMAYGITNASQIQVRRVDQSTTQLTVQAEAFQE